MYNLFNVIVENRNLYRFPQTKANRKTKLKRENSIESESVPDGIRTLCMCTKHVRKTCTQNWRQHCDTDSDTVPTITSVDERKEQPGY